MENDEVENMDIESGDSKESQSVEMSDFSDGVPPGGRSAPLLQQDPASAITAQPQRTASPVFPTWTAGNTAPQQNPDLIPVKTPGPGATPPAESSDSHLQAQHAPGDDTEPRDNGASPGAVQLQDTPVSEDRGAGGAKPSAPPAKVFIKVEWTPPPPDRRKAALKKALQSCFNTALPGCEVVNLQFGHDEHHAEVEISPSQALNVLKEMKTATLTFKGSNQKGVVHFLLDEVPNPEPIVGENEDLDLYRSEDVNAMRNDSKSEVPQISETSGAPLAFTVPLIQYWYLSNAYRKELSQIQQQFGVQIDAEVSVSVKALDPTRTDSVGKATQGFVDLFQTSLTSLKSLPIPQPQLDSDIVKDVVRNIQTDEAKMVLTMSADECLLCGPEQVISGVQNRMNLESGMTFRRSWGSMAEEVKTGSRSSSQSSTLQMDIKDSHEPIMIDDALWELMRKTCLTQISEIENKYGVQVSVLRGQGYTQVGVKSKEDQHVNLESHAHRAFMHLYQKISMTAIACPLNEPFWEKTDGMNRELERHRLVGVEETYGSWKLVGLPRDVVCAIADMEQLVGKPVFDDKMKNLLEYPGLFRRFSGHSWGQEGGSSAAWEQNTSLNSPEKAELRNSTRRGSDTSKDEDCPICMDTLTDPWKLKCGHGFCRVCLQQAVTSLGEICPVCKEIFGTLRGNQPEGRMTSRRDRETLPGFPGCGTIVIDYFIPGGVQTDKHPNPGSLFGGTQRQAFLPDSAEGRQVLELLKRAFDQRLIFTVGTSTTTGAENTVTWNDVHHKTSRAGGPERFGYPDPHYLRRVREELKAKGIE